MAALGRESGHPDRTGLVAVAAALWGLDGLLRKPLASALNPATVVLWEHLIVVVLVAPAVPAALRVLRRCSWRDRLAVAVIGIAASASATALFTEAFRRAAQTGDFVGPLVMQKLQPLFAVCFAAMLLRERMRAGFVLYAAPALAGSWLLAFPQPLHAHPTAAAVALFSIGAAVLWALGTVLGRLVSPAVGPRELTVLRYLWGLPAAAAITWQQHAAWAPGAGNLLGLLLLALIPGLFSLMIYYVGLRATAATRATFAELAFPATAALIGVAFLDTHLDLSQWLGFLMVVAAVTALSWHERVRSPAVLVPEPGPVAEHPAPEPVG